MLSLWFHSLLIRQTFLIFIFYFYSCLIGTVPALVFICDVCVHRAQLLGLQMPGFTGLEEPGTVFVQLVAR